MIHYCIPTYRSFAECRRGIEAALAGTRPPDTINIIDNSSHSGFSDSIKDLLDDYSNITVWPQGTNIGVAPAWNKFIVTIGSDYVVIANDDVAVHSHTLESLENALKDDSSGAVYAGPPGLNLFSLFCIPQAAFNRIGPFDEAFFPAYYEDNDYVRRCILAAERIVHIPEVTYDHIGSSTIKKYSASEMSLHHAAHAKNERYYNEKWGGPPWHERYTTPFNRG
jgi:GT2 family glycosyltransferase